MHKVVMIITGSIAAFKALDVIRGLRKAGVDVVPVLTKGGEMFVTPLTVSVLSGSKTYTDFSSLEEGYGMGHIELSRGADLVVVCPAGAEAIGRVACGRADDLAGALMLARCCPLLMFPAMNPEMWKNPAVVEHVSRLRSWDVEVRDPASGETACGEEGAGRLEEPLDIVEVILERLGLGDEGGIDLHGYHFLITAGPTRERLDSVRVLTNMSTGLQGYELARQARRWGARVTLVSGPVDSGLRGLVGEGVHVVEVESACEMAKACEEALPCDVAIGCAAVGDWYVPGVTKSALKRPKGEGFGNFSFASTPDVIGSIGLLEEGRPDLVVGFAAETDEGEQKAREKMKRKGCDWMVLNDPREGMGGAFNQVTLLKGEEEESWERMSKEEVALRLMKALSSALVGLRRGRV